MSDENRNMKINSELIMDAMGDIDEDLLREADSFRNGSAPAVKKKRPIGRIIALPIAAAAILTVGIIIMGPMGALRTKSEYSSSAPASYDGAMYSDSASEATADSAASDMSDAYEGEAYEEEAAASYEEDLWTSDRESLSGKTNSEENFYNSDSLEIEDERSIISLWIYTGYVDEAANWTGCDDFINKDYDGDSDYDRLYRYYYVEENAYLDSEYADYTIEFGNGRTIEINRVPNTGFPNISGADLDGDGENEIIFTLTYETSTDPMAYCQVWVFDPDKNGMYKEVELPFQNNEFGEISLDIEYEKLEERVLFINFPQLSYSARAELDQDYIDGYLLNGQDVPRTETRTVGIVSPKYEDGSCYLECQLEVLFKYGMMLRFNIRYDNGKYTVTDISL